MAYKPGRQRVQVEVAHPVAAHYHCGALFIECVHDGLQRFGRRIKVVTVELYGKTSATRIVNGHVPAAAYAEVGTPRDDMYQPLVRIAVEQLCGVVRRVVVNHNHVKLERSLLRQRAVNGVTDCLLAVAHRNYHSSLDVEILFVKIWFGIIRRVNQRPYCFQVCRYGLFHFHLHVAVGRVYIVKLPHAARPCVAFFLRIKQLVDMEHPPVTAQIEPEFIPSGIPVISFFCTSCKRMQQSRVNHDNRAEVEIIAQAAFLPVNHGMGFFLSAAHRPTV